jgi:hypothetical protein
VGVLQDRLEPGLLKRGIRAESALTRKDLKHLIRGADILRPGEIGILRRLHIADTDPRTIFGRSSDLSNNPFGDTNQLPYFKAPENDGRD